jgi:hypothetical protein
MLYQPIPTPTPVVQRGPVLATRRPTRTRAILEDLRVRRPHLDEPEVVTTAEVAECGCPDWCHRDHERE